MFHYEIYSIEVVYLWVDGFMIRLYGTDIRMI